MSSEGDLIVGDSNGTVHVLNMNSGTESLNTIENAHDVRYLFIVRVFDFAVLLYSLDAISLLFLSFLMALRKLVKIRDFDHSDTITSVIFAAVANKSRIKYLIRAYFNFLIPLHSN